MQSDGGEYESEYEEEEEEKEEEEEEGKRGNTAVAIETLGGDRGEDEVAVGRSVRANSADRVDGESAQPAAAVNGEYHTENSADAVGEDRDADTNEALLVTRPVKTPGASASSLNSGVGIAEPDMRLEDTAIATQIHTEPGSTTTPPSKAPPRRLAADVARYQRLERLLNQSKKVNAELRSQLQRLYRNDAIAQLENRAKEKQTRIDELAQENRLLKQQQRQLSKEIEDFNESKDNFPAERRALTEQLRKYKEKIQELKHARQTSDDKLAKFHQQVVDLKVKNKALTEQIRSLEDSSVSSASGGSSSRLVSHTQEIETVIASQEKEITRLQQRVELMKKSHKAERSKLEAQLKASQDEVELSRQSLEAFEQQVAQRDKTTRAQYLSLKTLKRAVHELALAHQSNQHLEQLLSDREVRYANGRSPKARGQRHHAHSHHYASGRKADESSSLVHSSSAFHRTSERLYDTLLHLGYVPPLKSPGKGNQSTARSQSGVSIDHDEVSSTRDVGDEPEQYESSLGIEFVQGKLIPRPPPPSLGDTEAARASLGSRSNSARFKLHSTRSPSSGELSDQRSSHVASKSEFPLAVHGSRERSAVRDEEQLCVGQSEVEEDTGAIEPSSQHSPDNVA